MDTFLAIIALLLALIGVAGCILPVLPGTPICYVGMILMTCTEYSTLTICFPRGFRAVSEARSMVQEVQQSEWSWACFSALWD